MNYYPHFKTFISKKLEKLAFGYSYACLFGIVFAGGSELIAAGGHSEFQGNGETLPWQSMPEEFVRKKIKTTSPEKSQYTWHQQEIDQLREDNNELRERLHESLVAREELYQTQKALLINLEMELARTGVLRQSLQTAVQKWESYKNKWQDRVRQEGVAAQELEQYKEMLKVKEREFQIKTEKLKQEIRILAEAFATSQKVINAFKQQQVNKEEPQPKLSATEGEVVALGEDLDLNELDLNEHTEKGQKDPNDVPITEPTDARGEMVYVAYDEKERPPFYVSSMKVTNQEYQCFVRAINYKRPVHWPKGGLPLELENRPVVNVTYEDAFLYSIWLGKRLPSQDELLRAERAGILIDLEDDINEWTATPEMKRGTHRLFSAQNKSDMALPNSTFNATTGFRIASDSK
ncbi:MAG TPA: SUMF1/EgtB/PvdO family nonheme iron enzyme [Waddliaceae bacterium]